MTGGLDLDLTCRSGGLRNTQVRPDLRSGVSEKTQVRSVLRSREPRDLDLRPGPDRSIFGLLFFLFSVWWSWRKDRRGPPVWTTRRGGQFIDENDESPTDDQDLWLTERNDVTTDHTGQVGLGRYP